MELTREQVEEWARSGIPAENMHAYEFRRKTADMALAHLSEKERSGRLADGKIKAVHTIIGNVTHVLEILSIGIEPGGYVITVAPVTITIHAAGEGNGGEDTVTTASQEAPAPERCPAPAAPVDSRSRLRRIAAQKGEPVPTFAPPAAQQEPVGFIDYPSLQFRVNGAWSRDAAVSVKCEPLPLYTRPAAAQQPAPEGWISVHKRVPKDGIPVLVVWADLTCPMDVCRIENGTWFDADTECDDDFRNPTHWMPLPSAPQPKEPL